MQHQMTIPKVYFEVLQIEEEVTVEWLKMACSLKRFIKYSTIFAEQLLANLIDKELSGQELLETFKEAKSNTTRTIFRAVHDNDTI